MEKLEVLCTADIDVKVLDEFSNHINIVCDGYYNSFEVMAHEELVRKISNYDILICEYDTVSADVISAAKKLKLIICCRGGVKSVVDIDEAKSKSIIVCNTPGRNANAVSDFTMGFILDITRNISLTNNLIHDRKITAIETTKPKEYKDTVWGLDKESPFIRYRGRSVNHMTLGIVGFGRSGRLVAKKANAFDMQIIVFDPYVDFSTAPSYVNEVEFEELLRRSDIVSLHCNVTQDSPLLSYKEFETMKDNSIFINTARGELVDENAMIKALHTGQIAAAAIDVAKEEPIAPDSPLLEVPNLLITPHIAGSSDDVKIQGSIMVRDAIHSFLQGNTPEHSI